MQQFDAVKREEGFVFSKLSVCSLNLFKAVCSSFKLSNLERFLYLESCLYVVRSCLQQFEAVNRGEVLYFESCPKKFEAFCSCLQQFKAV